MPKAERRVPASAVMCSAAFGSSDSSPVACLNPRDVHPTGYAILGQYHVDWILH